MRTIESEIHEILLDLAPDAHELEDQARIVATASNLYEKASSSFNKRTAGKSASQNPEKVREAQIVDSIFQAMNMLDDWHVTTASVEEEDAFDAAFVDGRGLDPNQIVQRAASTVMGRFAKKDFGDMKFINDDELDEMFGHPKGQDVENYFIDDAEEDHDPELYRVPGLGTHRSDFFGGR